MMFISLPHVWKIGKIAASIKKDTVLVEAAAEADLHKPLVETIVRNLKADKTLAMLKPPMLARTALNT